MSEGPLFEIGDALKIGGVVLEALRPVCERISLAGSCRRKLLYVHDVDLVVWPKCRAVASSQLTFFEDAESVLMPVDLYEVLQAAGLTGDVVPESYPRKLALGLCGERQIPVELYLCEPDGNNFEALLQMRTGSAEFNIHLAERAKRMGLRYKAGYGVFCGAERVDDGTEQGVFAALGFGWMPPEQRLDGRTMQAARFGLGAVAFLEEREGLDKPLD